MAPEYRTPGVYIEEQPAFPNTIVSVPTSIPVFIGYTERALRGADDLTGLPVRIETLQEFEILYGGAPEVTFKAVKETITLHENAGFKLYRSMQFYFANGGGPCWIVSVGDYSKDPSKGPLTEPLAKETGVLEKTPEPAILCIPEAVSLSAEDWKTVMEAAINHCARIRSRVVLVDVHNGHKPRDHTDQDVISGTTGLWSLSLGSLDYAASYYPWLNTNLVPLSEITIDRFDPTGRQLLRKALESDAAEDQALAADLGMLADILTGTTKNGPPPPDEGAPLTTMLPLNAHKAALGMSPSYRTLCEYALALLNVMPASPAMAGIYARTDSNFGVHKAPANTGVMSVIAPTVDISTREQEDLNVPLNGMAVNAIRTFLGRGVLVWGARTMNGNSNDWRYINVRRTMIMLEQSITLGLQSFVFEPNTASTWATIRSAITNFMTTQWKTGALAGPTSEEAFFVEVGLGTTMTEADIDAGLLSVSVGVALTRPAEFIILKITQRMQTS